MPKKAAKKSQANSRKIIRLIGEAFVVLVVLAIVGVNIHNFLSSKKVLAANVQVEYSQEQLEQEMKYWQKISASHPTYRDAYIEMSDIAGKLGDSQKAEEFLKRASFVDPH